MPWIKSALKISSAPPTPPTPTTHIYGVQWDGTSTTSWTRTDDAASFSDPIPYVSGASTYSSPFDNLMPWSGMEIVDDTDAGKLVSIPKFWYKITQNPSTHDLKIQIADYEADGFIVSPAHANRYDGIGERDVIYVGRYHCANTTYKSTTESKPQVYTTRANFRTAIHNLGEDIWQWDFMTRFTIWLLYLVEFANWNSQDSIGYGCGYGYSSSNWDVGATDSMPYHTGTTESNRYSYGYTQYRYIEGLWDNVMDWVDGCYSNSNRFYFIPRPSSFSDSGNDGVPLGSPSSGYPTQFTIQNVMGGILQFFIPTSSGGSDSTYSCDTWNFESSMPCVCSGGFYSQSDNPLNQGLFCNYARSTSYNGNEVGSRLMKLPNL